MKTLVLAALLAANWDVARAREVLTQRPFLVTDTSQADRPHYRLTFSARAARSLRRGFVFNGLAHDTLTDSDVRVRFKFVRPGRIVNFRGPPADLSQPAFPIRAAFYYAWYPEAWSRGSVFSYSGFEPSLDSTRPTTHASCAPTSMRCSTDTSTPASIPGGERSGIR